MKHERRKFARYIIRADELKVFSSDLKIVGSVQDLSKGGLAFQYTPITGRKAETKNINIVAKDKDQVFLVHVDCRTIYDLPVLEQGAGFKGAERRQRGIKFLRLTESQQNQLHLLLNNYTV